MSLQSPFAFAAPSNYVAPPADPDTVLISSDYTLAAADTLTLVASPGLKVLVRQGAVIDVTLDGDVGVYKPEGNVTGLVTTASTHGAALISTQGSFSVTAQGVNADATGFALQGDYDELVINGDTTVSSLQSDATGVLHQGREGEIEVNGQLEVTALYRAYGIEAGEQTATNNAGEIHVEGEEAFGYVTGPGGGSQFTNFGDLDVRAVSQHGGGDGLPPLALGVGMIGGFFANSGHITVTSEGVALGAEMLSMQSAANLAGGVIQARATDPDGQAVGVALVAFTNTPNLFQNQGLIRADLAVTSILPAVAGQGPQENPSVDIVSNSGKIVGDITLGQMSDWIDNVGVLKGDVDLGSDGDLFDSHLGRFEGTVFGGEGDDTLLGSGQSDTIYGDDFGGAESGQDRISGYKGDDTVFGGVGDDTINGGLGADQLSGGSEADTFVYNRVSDSSALGYDLITDLTDMDTVDLHRIDADQNTGINDAFHLVSSFSGAAGELVVSYDAGSDLTSISADVDGDGVANLVIHVSGDHSDFTNFVL